MSRSASISARLLLCERTGRWAAALRRELTDPHVRIWETRTLDDCWKELAESPASFLILELSADVQSFTRRIAGLSRMFPSARWAVVAERAAADWEWWMREIGAVHFVVSPRRVAPLVQLACRHLAQVPPPSQEFSERIWSNLPWKPVEAASRRINS